MNLIDYSNIYAKLAADIVKVSEYRINDQGFLGVILYNCGWIESEEIISEVMKIFPQKKALSPRSLSNNQLTWNTIKKGIEGIRAVAEDLQKSPNGNLYLLVDGISNIDPLTRDSRFYKVDVGSYSKNILHQ